MSDDIAHLGVAFDQTGAEELLKKLKEVESQSIKTEKSTENFSAAIRDNTGAIAGSTAAMQRDIAEMLKLQQATQGASRATEQATRSSGALRSANDNTQKSMRATQNAALGLSRQFVDIGVSAQMGMNPLTILIQQGPQIADIFQQAAIQGQSLNGVFRTMYMQIAPLLAVLVPVGIVLGVIATAIGVAAHEINKSNKDIVSGLGLTADQLEKVKDKHVTMTDVIKGTWNATAKAFKDVFKDEISAVQTAFSKAYEFMLKGVKEHAVTVLGVWLGTFNAVKAVWGMLPAAMGDIAISAANGTIKATEWMVNKAIAGLNLLLGQANAMAKAIGLPGVGELKSVDFQEIANPWVGQAKKAGAVAAEAYFEGWGSRQAVASKIGDTLQAAILKAAQDRIKKEAGKAKAGPKAKKEKTEYSDLYHDAKYLESMSRAAGQAMDSEMTRVDQLLEKNTKLIEAYERQVALDKKRYDILADQGRADAGAAVDSVLLQDPMAETRRVAAAYAEIDRLRQEDVLNEEQAALAKRRIDQSIYQEKLAMASNYFGMFAGLQNSSNRKIAAIGRAAAITQATIDGILAVQKTLASIPFPFNIAAAAAVGASTAINVARIAGVKGFEAGGYTGDGGRKQVAGVVHGQEFVMNARATRKNLPMLEAMNSGRVIPKSPMNDNARPQRMTIVPSKYFDVVVDGRARSVAQPLANEARETAVTTAMTGVADEYQRRNVRRLS